MPNSEKKRRKQIKKTHLKAKDMFLILRRFFIGNVHGGVKVLDEISFTTQKPAIFDFFLTAYLNFLNFCSENPKICQFHFLLELDINFSNFILYFSTTNFFHPFSSVIYPLIFHSFSFAPLHLLLLETIRFHSICFALLSFFWI